MSSRERVHELIDQLSDDELTAAEQMLRRIHQVRRDPVLLALETAELDDEPESAEEARAVSEADEEIARGDVLADDQIKRELGL